MPVLPNHVNKLNAWLQLALGLWLVLSALALPHTSASQGNTWVVGVLAAVAAAAAIVGGVARALLVGAILGAWLFVSTWIVEYAANGTRFHNAVVAILLAALAFIPLRRPGRAEAREPQQASA